MTVRPEQASRARTAGEARAILVQLGRLPRVAPTLLVAIWVVLPLVPAESGLRFGLGFQLFFTAILGLSTAFFWLLGREWIPAPRSAPGVFASVAGVYLVTVGLLVAMAAVVPQFELPQPPGAEAQQDAVKRGEALFSKADVGCYLCHAIGGRGGTRGPDLTRVAARAGDRVPGLSVERYLVEKIKAGATYQYKVPEYLPMMPAFGQTLSEEQLADLVAYLLSGN